MSFTRLTPYPASPDATPGAAQSPPDPPPRSAQSDCASFAGDGHAHQTPASSLGSDGRPPTSEPNTAGLSAILGRLPSLSIVHARFSATPRIRAEVANITPSLRTPTPNTRTQHVDQKFCKQRYGPGSGGGRRGPELHICHSYPVALLAISVW